MLLNLQQHRGFSIGMYHPHGLHSLLLQFYLSALHYGFSSEVQPVGDYMLQEQRLDWPLV
jgi:hypothetical protein